MVVLTGVGCGGSGATGFRLDDRQRDDAVCGVGEENNSCGGAKQVELVANPHLREYTVAWLGTYKGLTEVLYARRFNAATGEPKGQSVELGRFAPDSKFSIAYDSRSHDYVIAAQRGQVVFDEYRGVRVQRFSEKLQPKGASRSLGHWELHTIVVEPRGRVAVVGAENPRSINVETDRAPLALRVQVLDARNRTVSVSRRPAGGTGSATGLAGAYDRHSHSLLVAWVPMFSGAEDSVVRIDRFAEGRRGGTATFPYPGKTLPEGGMNLSCNSRRRDCLLLYAPGIFVPTKLHARLLNPGGHLLGRDYVLANQTLGPMGSVATSRGYSFGWGELSDTLTTGRHIVVARLTGTPPHVARLFEKEIPGKTVQWTSSERSGTGLLAWRSRAGSERFTLQTPLGTPGWSRIFGEIVHWPT